jgi:hypothetical protein
LKGLIVAEWNDSPEFGTIQAMVSGEKAPESTEAVARRLELTRKAFDMKPAVWCEFVGISPSAWANVAGTKYKPPSNRISVDAAIKICRATGVGLDWIFRGDRADVPQKVAIALQRLDPPPPVSKRKQA